MTTMTGISKEDVLNWYQGLNASHRVEIICALLDHSLPFELRFLGSVIENLGRKDFHVLRDAECKANSLHSSEPTQDQTTILRFLSEGPNLATMGVSTGANISSHTNSTTNIQSNNANEISTNRPSSTQRTDPKVLASDGAKGAEETSQPVENGISSKCTPRGVTPDGKSNDKSYHTADLNGIEENESKGDIWLYDGTKRRKLILYLSLLAATNHDSANTYYLLLSDVEDWMTKLDWLDDLEEMIQDEILLLYTIGSHHPAFTFEQRTFLSTVLNRFKESLVRYSKHYGQSFLNPSSPLPNQILNHHYLPPQYFEKFRYYFCQTAQLIQQTMPSSQSFNPQSNSESVRAPTYPFASYPNFPVFMSAAPHSQHGSIGHPHQQFPTHPYPPNVVGSQLQGSIMPPNGLPPQTIPASTVSAAHRKQPGSVGPHHQQFPTHSFSQNVMTSQLPLQVQGQGSIMSTNGMSPQVQAIPTSTVPVPPHNKQHGSIGHPHQQFPTHPYPVSQPSLQGSIMSPNCPNGLPPQAIPASTVSVPAHRKQHGSVGHHQQFSPHSFPQGVVMSQLPLQNSIIPPNCLPPQTQATPPSTLPIPAHRKTDRYTQNIPFSMVHTQSPVGMIATGSKVLSMQSCPSTGPQLSQTHQSTVSTSTRSSSMASAVTAYQSQENSLDGDSEGSSENCAWDSPESSPFESPPQSLTPSRSQSPRSAIQQPKSSKPEGGSCSVSCDAPKLQVNVNDPYTKHGPPSNTQPTSNVGLSLNSPGFVPIVSSNTLSGQPGRRGVILEVGGHVTGTDFTSINLSSLENALMPPLDDPLDINCRPRKISCYNCGSNNHVGPECKEASMEEMTRKQYRLNYGGPSADSKEGNKYYMD